MEIGGGDAGFLLNGAGVATRTCATLRLIPRPVVTPTREPERLREKCSSANSSSSRKAWRCWVAKKTQEDMKVESEETVYTWTKVARRTE